MEKHLHLIGETAPTFGLKVQNEEAYKRMRRHFVPLPENEKTPRSKKAGAWRGVEVKYIAPVLGAAAWIVTERREYDLFQIDGAGEFFKIIYDDQGGGKK